jgi:RNA polymerase sigma factor (sigma-70 family)
VSETLEITNDVILKAQQGDTAKIGVLFQRYHQTVFRYLYYRVNDLHTAEDLTSEVFMRMLRALPDYRLQGVSFQAWLFQIARNLSVDYFRKSSIHPNVELQNQTTGPRRCSREQPAVKLAESVSAVAFRSTGCCPVVLGLPLRSPLLRRKIHQRSSAEDSRSRTT